MTGPDLPDDPRDWPADPFALLGVPPGAPEADVKRAYTRLIRRFKPEHHPDQFRRVRDAYEACLDRAGWYRPEPVGERESVSVPFHVPPAPPVPVADEVTRLWELAAAGDATGYAGLVQEASARPDRADIPLRLYWLLAVSPALDTARSRHDWLASALAKSRLRGPAAEVYRRELDADPDVGLYGPYTDLLATPAAGPDLLAVARWRIAAAGRTWRQYPLVADLKLLRGRLAKLDFSDADWLGVLTTAADWAAWHPMADAKTAYSAELAAVRHLESAHPAAFDRLEETEFVASEAVAAQRAGVPDALVGLVRAAWAEGDAARPAEVAAAVAAVAADPSAALDRFDRVASQRGPGFLILVVRTLERIRHARGPTDHPAFRPDLVRGLARELSDRKRYVAYLTARVQLLAFLTAEAIHPLEFADACDDDPDAWYRGLAESARGDVALRAVWLASRLHRG